MEIDGHGDTDEDATDTTEPKISLLAIFGVCTCDTMQVAVQLGHITVTALLDSGSTQLRLRGGCITYGPLLHPHTDFAVTVSNGDRVRCPGVFCDAQPFRSDVYVLPLGGYDMVLGTDWLAMLGPILWDFGCHTMSLWRSNRRVRWRGVAGPTSSQVHATHGPDLLSLLAEFSDVFATPMGLPPPRARDHFIHLLPDMGPVAVRPYRYPQMQKDEFERKCRALEAQGLIRLSFLRSRPPGEEG